jgi:nitroreductase
MTKILPQPQFGEALPAACPSDEAARLLSCRRSTAPDFLGEPGPARGEIDAILRIGARVPDHRRVVPFRFILFEGEARARAGTILAAAFRDNEPEAPAEKAAFEGARFLRAPLVVAVVSKVDRAHRTPAWEQILTAGAVCQNLLLAASAFGFGASWITEWYGYDRGVLAGFGIADEERIAGFVYIGTAREAPKERQRPDVGALTCRF